MNLHIQDFPSIEIDQEEPELLRLEDILPNDFDAPMAEDLVISSHFWDQRPSFEDRMTKNALLMAWRVGRLGDMEAVNAMISYGVLPFKEVMEYLAARARIAAKMEG